jgi:hypothetical protein
MSKLKIKYGEKKFMAGYVNYNLYFYVKSDIYIIPLEHKSHFTKRVFYKKPLLGFLITPHDLFIWLYAKDDLVEKKDLVNYSKKDIEIIVGKLYNIAPETKRDILKAL